MSKVCNKCNAQIDDSVAFCPNCGNNVAIANNGMNGVQNDSVKPDLGFGNFSSGVSQDSQLNY